MEYLLKGSNSFWVKIKIKFWKGKKYDLLIEVLTPFFFLGRKIDFVHLREIKYLLKGSNSLWVFLVKIFVCSLKENIISFRQIKFFMSSLGEEKLCPLMEVYDIFILHVPEEHEALCNDSRFFLYYSVQYTENSVNFRRVSVLLLFWY